MANYYLDTEFLEGPQDKRIFGFKYGETKPTVDLISIALVSDDGREYYAISKDFNLYDAWHRFDLKDTGKSDLPGINRSSEKVYWIRDNVLLPIYRDYIGGDLRNRFQFSYQTMKWILEKYGKSNQKIAEEVKEFCRKGYNKIYYHNDEKLGYGAMHPGDKYFYSKAFSQDTDPKFFAYFADYDWVVFCWLFGKMIDLPKGFPMYCVDLKQELDSFAMTMYPHKLASEGFDAALNEVKSLPKFPKQSNNHNALADARWNKQLHKFINKIQI